MLQLGVGHCPWTLTAQAFARCNSCQSQFVQRAEPSITQRVGRNCVAQPVRMVLPITRQRGRHVGLSTIELCRSSFHADGSIASSRNCMRTGPAARRPSGPPVERAFSKSEVNAWPSRSATKDWSMPCYEPIWPLRCSPFVTPCSALRRLAVGQPLSLSNKPEWRAR